MITVKAKKRGTQEVFKENGEGFERWVVETIEVLVMDLKGQQKECAF